ncbi:hypothetical protein [Acidipropionibacterium virtanenii]|uniref:Tetratricopeptide repeat protein n=1 Tax=Acidipropionibacterium virtanenii TaxID=2057246 RepID=A0A344UT43_9ACTN|nr:hypothetical protein [Acidipropionibacterium virtanenii]AXE38441.1 hypothetical protein JS278_01265 [Acidipropionibacterium virtanenii]
MTHTAFPGQAEGFGSWLPSDSEPGVRTAHLDDPLPAADLYKELALPRDETTAEIQKRLRGLRRDWTAKAMRKNSMTERAQIQLGFVSQAERVFFSDEMRRRYDLSLVTGPEKDDEVDWLTRAWNYYFQRDEGAAAVAARKAREQHPEDRMVYVVAAWVTLLTAADDKDEIRRAKQDADEAFVLDELGEDTADVHHVRAVAYLGLEDYDRGLVSIERALRRAAPDEMPHMYLVKGSLHQGRKEYEEMFSASIDGLEATPNLIEEDQRRLTDNLLAALTGLCYFPGAPVRSIAACSNRTTNVGNTRIPEDSKNQAREMLGKLKHIAELEAVQDVDYNRPEYLCRMFGIGVVLAIFGYMSGAVGYSSTATGSFALGLLVIVISGIQAYRRSVWNDKRRAYKAAQTELSVLESQLPGRLRAIVKLKRSWQLVVG